MIKTLLKYDLQSNISKDNKLKDTIEHCNVGIRYFDQFYRGIGEKNTEEEFMTPVVDYDGHK